MKRPENKTLLSMKNSRNSLRGRASYILYILLFKSSFIFLKELRFSAVLEVCEQVDAGSMCESVFLLLRQDVLVEVLLMARCHALLSTWGCPGSSGAAGESRACRHVAFLIASSCQL